MVWALMFVIKIVPSLISWSGVLINHQSKFKSTQTQSHGPQKTQSTAPNLLAANPVYDVKHYPIASLPSPL